MCLVLGSSEDVTFRAKEKENNKNQADGVDRQGIVISALSGMYPARALGRGCGLILSWLQVLINECKPHTL
jgi:hypothetical protein